MDKIKHFIDHIKNIPIHNGKLYEKFWISYNGREDNPIQTKKLFEGFATKSPFINDTQSKNPNLYKDLYSDLKNYQLTEIDNYEKIKHLNLFRETWDNKGKIPLAVKDIYLLKGKNVRAGSLVLDNFIAPYTSTILKRLEDYFSFVGYTTMDEFAMGSFGTNNFNKIARNPWNENYVCGGSSSGSAGAVASGIVPVALGTDTGGSIRLPACWTGIVGFKPTYGVLSRYGIIDYVSSLDCPGFFARYVRDIKLLLDITKGKDEKDPTSVDLLPSSSFKKKVFILNNKSEAKNLIDKTADYLKTQGFEVKYIDLPSLENVVALYAVNAFSEAASNLSRYESLLYDKKPFHPEIQTRIHWGKYFSYEAHLDDYYFKGRKLINNLYEEAMEYLSDGDAIIMPVSETTAVKYQENYDSVEMWTTDKYTCFANLIGFPALAIPGDIINGLPIGLQILGKPLEDLNLLNLGEIIDNYLKGWEKTAQFMEKKYA